MHLRTALTALLLATLPLAALAQSVRPAASVPLVFDGSGHELGAFVEVNGGLVRVLHEGLGVTYFVDTRTGTHVSRFVTYEEPLCNGQRYVDSFFSNTVFPAPLSPGSLLVGSTVVFLPADSHQSVAQTDGSCIESVASNSNVVEVDDFFAGLGIAFPVALPIWIGNRDAPGCGLGPELALLLPPLWVVRRIRTARKKAGLGGSKS